MLGATDRNRTGMASSVSRGTCQAGRFRGHRPYGRRPGRGRTRRLLQCCAHGGGRGGISLLLAAWVAKRRGGGGVPESVHQLLGGGAVPRGDGRTPAHGACRAELRRQAYELVSAWSR